MEPSHEKYSMPHLEGESLPLVNAPHDHSPSDSDGQRPPPEIIREDPEKYDNDDDSKKEGGEGERRGGRRKINIEFIENKSRRHVTFSKRKAGLIKKAYELSTLTGTQVLLLVASETGNVYTFATPKLQPLITKPEGKTLIQACLNPPEIPESPQTPSAATVVSMPHHQARMPVESHYVPEKQKTVTNSTYQTKEIMQNWNAPLQERVMKDPSKMLASNPSTAGMAMSELGNYNAYNNSVVSQSYPQYNYGNSIGSIERPGYGSSSLNASRYNYPSQTMQYDRQFSSLHQNSQGGPYAATPSSSAYMYSPIGSNPSTPFTTSIDNNSKDSTV